MKRMKNLTLAVLVTVIGTGWAAAQEVAMDGTGVSNPDNIQIVSGADSRYKLVYPVKRAETVWIKIYDPDKHLLLSERVKNQDGFMKSYDFSNLSDGVYTIDVQSKDDKITKEVYHKYRQNDIDVSVEKHPEKNSYYLLVKGVRRDPVYVDILDAKKNTLYVDVVNVGKNFSRVYRFKDELPEDVTFKVSSAYQEVIKEVK